MFMEVEAEGKVEGALDSVDTDLAVALGGVAVAAGEESTGNEDGEVEAGAGGELADVEVAAEGAGRAGAEGTIFGASYSHDAGEGADGDDRGGEGLRGLVVELPVEEVRLTEVIGEKAKAFDDAGPTPAVMVCGENVDLEDVAGFGSLNIDRSGEGVDAGAVDV